MALAGIVVAGLLAHAVVLLSDYVVWDGWSYQHWLGHPGQTEHLQRLFHEVGRPLDFLFLIPFVGAPKLVVTAKVAGVVTWIFASCLMYLVLIRTKLASPNAALICAAVAVVLPVFDVLGDVSIWMNTACVALFWAGWWLVTAKPSTLWLRTLSRAAALLCFFLSFNLNSQLVVFYAFAACAVALPHLSDGVSAVIKACRRALLNYPDFAFLPVLFWIWKRLFTPNSGYYVGYNNPTLSVDALLTAGHSLWAGLLGAEAALLLESSSWVAASIAVVVFAGVLAARARWVWPPSGSRSEFGRLLAAGFVLLLAGAFPYAVVGQAFQSFGWLSRNCILFPLPLAMMITAGAGLIGAALAPTRRGLVWAVIAFLVLLCIGSSNRTSLRWQAFGAKQLSIATKLQPVLAEKEPALVQLRDYFLLPQTIYYYPPIIWTHIMARDLETPKTLVLETSQMSPDRMVVDAEGQPQRQVTVLAIDKPAMRQIIDQTTMPYAMSGIPHNGRQLLAVVEPGELGTDGVTLGWDYMIRRIFDPSAIPDFLNRLTVVQTQELPSIP